MRGPKPNPDSKAQRCLAVLRDGPATTGEVAAETGLDPQNAGSHLYLLFKRGLVARTPYDARKLADGRQRTWLWQVAA